MVASPWLMGLATAVKTAQERERERKKQALETMFGMYKAGFKPAGAPAALKGAQIGGGIGKTVATGDPETAIETMGDIGETAGWGAEDVGVTTEARKQKEFEFEKKYKTEEQKRKQQELTQKRAKEAKPTKAAQAKEDKAIVETGVREILDPLKSQRAQGTLTRDTAITAIREANAYISASGLPAYAQNDLRNKLTRKAMIEIQEDEELNVNIYGKAPGRKSIMGIPYGTTRGTLEGF